MKENDLFVALDLGCTEVRACVARTAAGARPEILGVGLWRPSGLFRGIVTDVEQTVESVRQAVAQATGAAGVAVQRAVVGVGGELVETTTAVGAAQVGSASGTVSHADVRRAVSTAALRALPKDSQRLHALPRTFVVDKRRTETPVGMNGSYLEVEVHLVSGPVNDLNTITRCVQTAGIRKITAFVLDVLASGAAALPEEIRRAGGILVDMGGDYTSLVVYHRNRVVYTNIIPVGGSHITNDIAYCFGMPFDAAEEIKRSQGHASVDGVKPDEYIHITRFEQRRPAVIRRRKLAWVIESRVDEWLRLIRRALDEAGVLGRVPGGITLVGGSATLPGLVERATNALGMECVLGYPGGVNGHLDMLHYPSMASCVGLVHCAISPPDKLASGPKSLWWHRITRFATRLRESFS